MESRLANTENDADDSDSLSDSGYAPHRIPRRSATVSPAARSRFRHHSKSRRRSDANLSMPTRRPCSRRTSADKSPRYESRALRKTTSLPSVEQTQLAHVDAIRQLLNSFPIQSSCSQSASANDVWSTPRQSIVVATLGTDSDGDMINTDIEELREAAESIQSLQRVLKIPSEMTAKKEEESNETDERPSGGESSSETLRRCSGIASRLGGHPRGVIQFLPSVKQAQFVPTLDTYNWSKSNRESDSERKPSLIRRKTSMPETYMTYNQVYNSDQIAGRPASGRGNRRLMRNSEEPELFKAKGTELLEQSKGADSLAGVSRFSKLLRSLRSSRQNSPEPQTSMAWTPLIIPDASQHQLQQSLLQADLLLWKKRSRASLRRHNEIRNMAIRELHDTEKSFVEGLEYLIQKYMRPLRQPLECTLIDSGLADKIFYRIPEILIHHQHFLAALRDRLENFQSDTRIGDVLLSHFKKQSMIETYIAFVDNFKFAKQAIAEARAKPAFEKYYMRCCRDHRNKLDLDSLLISPIQRVPRYELILKQIVKHTSVEHTDYENLLVAQKHIHELAITINRQKEESEEMEQRLREIEAIVDGLDDLVTTGRSFNRYDVVTISSSGGTKQRCLFLMSDQIILTSVRRKSPATRTGRNSAPLVQSADFLDSNRFKLLFKISLDDIEISKDSLSLLQSTELKLQTTQEDVNIISKMIELSKLLKNEHSSGQWATPIATAETVLQREDHIEALTTMLDNMRTERMQELRKLQEQLTSDPELTTVHLQVTTINGNESLTIHFSNADKRAIWENALVEAKNALMNSLQNDQAPNHLRSIVTHRTRPGLIFSVASPTLGKSMEGGAPNVWVCTTDKFSGQIAVVNVNGEPTIESSTGIGNAAIVAICPVPSPRKRRKMSVKPPVDEHTNEIPGLELDSSSSDSDDSDSDSSRRNVQSTIWIGNDDGEIFVFNFLDNVRLKSREKMTRLPLPIDDIVYVDERVFVSLSSSSHVQLLYFQRGKEGNWDMENSKNVRLDLRTRLRPMLAVVSRLCIASANSLYLINPSTTKIEKSAQVSSYPSETVGCMAAHGSTIFVAMNKSSIVKVVNAFTLDCLLEFSISHVINKTLSTQEDIIRQHKMGCLRISALLCCKNRLWIGTSAGIILNMNIASTKTNWTPTFNVCKAGHIGPCRFLTAVSVSSSAMLFDMRRRRMSLNAPSLQQLDQVFVISGGEGYDNNDTEIREEKTGIDDAVNHLLFWTA